MKNSLLNTEENPALLAKHLLRALGHENHQAGLALATKAYKAFLKGATCEPIQPNEITALPDGLFITKTQSSHQPSETTPLVIYRDRVYLHKVNALEHQLAEHIIALTQRPKVFGDKININEATLNLVVQKCGVSLPPSPSQTKAVTNFGQHGVLILTGGPGTGKTTTASLMIRLAAELAQLDLSQLRLCAPTGRAKSKLNLSVSNSAYIKTLPNTDLPPAHTVQKYVANPDMLQNAKMIVVDECSMVDLGNFNKLLGIIREQCPDARLVLMGDHEQLPSIDTGSVYFDLCNAACIIPNKSRLTDNHRLGEEPLAWAKYVHQDAGAKDLSNQLKAPDAKAIIELAIPIFSEGITTALEGDEIKALEQIDKLRILCSHKGGKVGVRALNREIRKHLGLTRDDSPGSLVMITQNDHDVTGLSNGDVGIVLKNQLVCFPRTKESDTHDSSKYMVINFSQLPPHEPAFATTIHKSQGSEYQHVIVVISSKDDIEETSPDGSFINRNLVFTGITRAISKIDVFAKKSVFENAITDTFTRASGLQERLDEMQPQPSAAQ